MKKQYLCPQMELCVIFSAEVLTASKEAFTVDDFKSIWLDDFDQ